MYRAVNRLEVDGASLDPRRDSAGAKRLRTGSSLSRGNAKGMLMSQSVGRRRALLATAAVLQLAMAGYAQAQTAPATTDENEITEVVVTGTAIRGVAPVGSATVNLDRETIVQAGVRDA